MSRSAWLLERVEVVGEAQGVVAVAVQAQQQVRGDALLERSACAGSDCRRRILALAQGDDLLVAGVELGQHSRIQAVLSVIAGAAHCAVQVAQQPVHLSRPGLPTAGVLLDAGSSLPARPPTRRAAHTTGRPRTHNNVRRRAAGPYPT